MAQRRALLIGVPEYSSDAIKDLPFIRNDINGLQKSLRKLDFHVETLGADDKKSPSGGDIRGKLNHFCRSARKEDMLVICFSGHGLHYKGSDYLVPCDADISDPDLEDYLIPVDLGKKFEDSAAGSILFFIDACREGIELDSKSLSAFRRWSSGKLSLSKERSIAFIFACEKGEVSRFVEGEQGFSLFSRSLTETLQSAQTLNSLKSLVNSLQKRLDELADEHGKPRQKIRIRTETGANDVLFDLFDDQASKETSPPPKKNPVDAAKLRRLQNRREELQQQYDLLSENIRAYNDDYLNETQESRKTPIKRKREKEYAEREEVERKIQNIEAEIDTLRAETDNIE